MPSPWSAAALDVEARSEARRRRQRERPSRRIPAGWARAILTDHRGVGVHGDLEITMQNARNFDGSVAAKPAKPAD
jgi:hypothetical protein